MRSVSQSVSLFTVPPRGALGARSRYLEMGHIALYTHLAILDTGDRSFRSRQVSTSFRGCGPLGIERPVLRTGSITLLRYVSLPPGTLRQSMGAWSGRLRPPSLEGHDATRPLHVMRRAARSLSLLPLICVERPWTRSRLTWARIVRQRVDVSVGGPPSGIV